MASPGHRRFDIQGLRAIAVLSVVAYHAGLPVPGGFIGVDVFFVISGFVITAMLAREWAGNGRIRFGQFYLRRFKRLTPALALMVTVTVIASAVVLSPLGPQQTAARTGIGAILLVANVVIARTTGGYFDAPAETNVLLHTWSLSVEEQFYLAFPLLLVIGWSVARWARARGSQGADRDGGAAATARAAAASGSRGVLPARVLGSAPVVIVSLVAVASFALATLGAAGYRLPHGTWLLEFYSPLTRAWEFAAGALLALGAARLVITSRWRAIAVGLVGAALLIASLWVITGATPFPGPWTLLPVVGTMLLILAGSEPTNAISRSLRARPMVAVGDWSYSIYLWHWPLIVIATVLWPAAGLAPLVAAAVSFLPAIISYRWVEQPLRRRQIVPGPVLVRVVAAVVTPPLVLAVASWLVADSYWSPRLETVAASPHQQHAMYTMGCWYDEHSGAVDPPPCRWQPDAPGAPVYLVGDSHAAALTEALVGASARIGRPLLATAGSACPLLDLRVTSPSRAGYDIACQEYARRVLTWLDGQPPGTVVIATTDNYWLNSKHGVMLADGTTTTRTDLKIAAMREALTRTVRSLQAAGHQVVLVQTVPSFRGDYAWAPARCSLSSTLAGCPQRMPAAASTQRSAAVRAALSSVGSATHAIVVDLTPEICPGGVCVTADSGGPVYADESHLTVYGDQRLVGAFTAVLSHPPVAAAVAGRGR